MTTTISGPRTVRAARGTTLTAQGWPQEAALRMLCNNLDPEVAERPNDLVVYGGNGRAARSWPAFDALVRTLQRLKNDETMIVQSGKPVAVWRTHERAPRVLIANSNLVPKWADYTIFRELEAQGLTMYGQMTAGSWIYIGTQGIVQGTYETFAELARQHFGGTLNGRICLTAGVGGMGGAQPLAITMNEGIALVVDVDRSRLERRRDLRYLDVVADSREAALREAEAARKEGRALSIGYEANAASEFWELYDLGFRPDAVTDQTSAHDLIDGYVPEGLSLGEAAALRASSPQEYERRSLESCGKHVEAMVRFLDAGAVVFDYGNNLRAQAQRAGYGRAFAFPGFVPAFIRPLFCRGSGPFRFAALSGDPADIHRLDRELLALFPNDAGLQRWIGLAHERIAFQGLPARICWLGYGDRAKAGVRFNELVRSGEIKAPIVIGRDHLDTGSVASPYRETEAMKDGSDAIADWPILNALLNTAAGAHWVSFHHGGGVGNDHHAGRAHDRLRHGHRTSRRCRLRTGDRNRRRKRHRLASLTLLRAKTIVPCTGDAPQSGVTFADLGAIRDGALLIEGERIAAIGARAHVEREMRGREAVEIETSGVVMPGFVDAHAHPLFDGDREPDFSSRLRGEKPQLGMLYTVARTRDALLDPDGFYQRVVHERLHRMLVHGTTTLETKTGYALHKPGEDALLDLIARHRHDADVPALVATFLGAHALPPEFTREEAYVDYLIDQVIPTAAAHGAVYADAFCEPGFFSPEQTRRYLQACEAAGMRLRVHCDEMSFGAAAEMAVGVGVDAVDHCNCIRTQDVEAIARAGIVTVACPATIAYLGLSEKTPVRALLERGGAVALASDYNPGTSPCFNLQTVAYFGRSLFELSAAEALYGVTRAAARSLRSDAGSLHAGAVADAVVLDIDSPDEFGWQFGGNLASAVFHRGLRVA